MEREHLEESGTKFGNNKLFVLFSAILFFVALTTVFSAVQTFRPFGQVNVQESSEKIKEAIELQGDLNLKETVPEQPKCGITNEEEKFDCHPERDPGEDRCLQRGCCWAPTVPRGTNKINGMELVGPPSCYYPPNYAGYEVTQVGETQTGILAKLKRIGPSGFPKDIQEVQVKVSFTSNDTFNVKISDPNSPRYEVPVPVLKPELLKRNQIDPQYQVVINQDATLTVTRKTTGIKIFDANLATMIFADQLLQLNVKVPTRGLYGIGESYDKLYRGKDWKRYVLFNKDNYPGDDLNLYGSHPFYMQTAKDGSYHGVLLFNSNGMDIVSQPTPAVTFRPIGGIFDFHFFMGPSPSQVVQQYLGLIGHPFMPPYWSLGYHLCRYGYQTTKGTRDVWQKTRDAGIPFDVQWNDIDYMRDRDDFTVDKERFGDLHVLVDDIHAAGMHYMMIMDVGVGGPELAGKYQPYDDGVMMDCLVKNSTGDVLMGKVWNEVSTVFPDFTHPMAGEYTTRQYELLYKDLKFDGSWIDMNEPSNFYSNGSIYGCPEDSTLEHPPYSPGNLEDLRIKTLCMTAQHYASTHYNVHNLHGFTNMIATNEALRRVLKKRPFIISRSTFPGAGFYGGHWDGDIASTWEDFRWTIPSLLTFQLFGVPMIGADICGFRNDTTEELCARWHALGAFYPFARNHNDIGTLAQDPASMSATVQNSAKTNLRIRYSLLPYLYTLFYKSHEYGETVARPLFFEFPQDIKTHDIDTTFLWGPAFLIIPVLQKGEKVVSAYIPEDTWYDFKTGQELQSTKRDVEFTAELDQINLLVRGGYILPAHEMDDTVTTTTESRKRNLQLYVALKDGKAEGDLYWDDGDSLDFEGSKKYSLLKFTVADKSLKSEATKTDYKIPSNLGSVFIMGAEKATKATIDGKALPAGSINYDEHTKTLRIGPISQPLMGTFTIQWE